MELLKCTVTQR